MRQQSLFVGAALAIGCGSSDTGSTGGDPDSSLGDGARDGVALDEGVRDTSTTGTDTTGTDGVTADTTATTDTATTETDDAGAMCVRGPGSSCGDPGLSCLCCAAGGPRENCTCSTKCTKDSDCTDASRPKCNQQAAGIEGFCTSPTFVCCWLCK